MRSNPVKDRLARGEPVFGPMILEMANPGLPQILAAAGADFIIYDMEAGCLDIAQVKTQIALTRGLDVVPLVNTAWHDYAYLSRPLDCGAMGLLVPVVQTAAEAERIVAVTRYPPDGVRGAAFGVAHDDYDAAGDVDAKVRAANARTLVAVKVETAQGVANADAILAVPGIDVAFIGHMDLAISLGVPGRYDSPEFRAAVDTVIAACRRHSKAGGCLVTTPEAGRLWLDRGFRFIVYSTDALLLGGAFKAGVAALRCG